MISDLLILMVSFTIGSKRWEKEEDDKRQQLTQTIWTLAHPMVSVSVATNTEQIFSPTRVPTWSRIISSLAPSRLTCWSPWRPTSCQPPGWRRRVPTCQGEALCRCSPYRLLIQLTLQNPQNHFQTLQNLLNLLSLLNHQNRWSLQNHWSLRQSCQIPKTHQCLQVVSCNKYKTPPTDTINDVHRSDSVLPLLDHVGHLKRIVSMRTSSQF